jgi:hypothetical protein
MPRVDLYGAAFTAIAAVLLLGLGLLFRFLQPHQDAREPPLAKPSIPIIGHILGLIYHGNSYLEKIT